MVPRGGQKCQETFFGQLKADPEGKKTMDGFYNLTTGTWIFMSASQTPSLGWKLT